MYVNHLTVHPPINGAFNKNQNWNWKDSDPVCWWKLRVGSRLQVDRWTGLDLLPTTYYLLPTTYYLLPTNSCLCTGYYGLLYPVVELGVGWDSENKKQETCIKSEQWNKRTRSTSESKPAPKKGRTAQHSTAQHSTKYCTRHTDLVNTYTYTYTYPYPYPYATGPTSWLAG
ncbi:hypothetical protein BO99DRAFT_413098 [Aspergillus violaceofuscus CBS 115571]|uniref:Uncharacterized protein n=1 Tax=Aspergillus violaceofuscus (strain CBS 115571) TaxID=1450538 RepID=A0A2V5H5R0_ASPV1|nr:hypothetical protein BO99DRAFT_413098 [Aspergillus violaceofuscus CBS 115571]